MYFERGKTPIYSRAQELIYKLLSKITNKLHFLIRL